MNNYPLVSIIVPNFNHFPFLKERVDSVIAQTYLNFEVILMDDCSKDKSRELLEQYRSHPKVSHIVYNETNSGSTFRQWNKGVELAKGEYIWIAESDDVAAPSFLQKVMSVYNSDPAVVLSFTQSYKLNYKSEITGSWLGFMKSTDKKLFLKDFIISGHNFITRSLIYKNTIPNASSLVFNKQVYLAIGGADITLRYCSDWLTWLKMATKGKVAYISEPLNYFRYHDSSVIASSKTSGEIFLKKYDIIMRNLFEKFVQNSYDNDYEILCLNSKQRSTELLVEQFVIYKEKRNYLAIIFFLIRNFRNFLFVSMLFEIYKNGIRARTRK